MPAALGERLQRRVLAEPAAIRELRRELEQYAQAVGASPTTRDAAKLALSEALTNVVVHAYVGSQPGPMIVDRFDGRKWTHNGARLLRGRRHGAPTG
ncbi:MAG: ATP-binding protein [Solirubrobacteraceae bacterium]